MPISPIAQGPRDDDAFEDAFDDAFEEESGETPAPALHALIGRPTGPTEAAGGGSDVRRLAGIGIAGLCLAAAVAAGLGAFGLWGAALLAAAAILFGSGVAVILTLGPARAGTRRRRKARAALAAVAEAMDRPAVLVGPDQALLAANGRYRALFGLMPPEAVGAAAQARVERDGAAFLARRIDHAGAALWMFEPEPRSPAPAPNLSLFSRALSHMEIGFALADAPGALILLNDQLATWMGVPSAQEVPALTARLLVDGKRAELKTGGGGTLSKMVMTADGGQKLIIVRRPSAGAGEEAGAASLVEALFDAAPVGVAFVGKDGSLGEFNKAFKRFAPNRRPARGDEVASYVADEDRADFAKRLAETFSGADHAAPLEVRFNTQPARTGQIFVSLAEQQDPPAAVMHLIETTQQRSLERQFVQAQKMQAVGQLAGGVAHDFNNLLTAIIGFCDLLLVRHGPGDQSFGDIMQIKQNANRAANLVRQLLAFSRQQTMRPKVLMVTDILADLANLLRRLIGETIALKMVHGRDVGAVKVDQGQLEQVIINLAVNARDAMEEGGALTIRTKAVGPDDKRVQNYSVMPAGDYVLIEVADTGSGIPPENLNKIFDPFFTTKEVGKGTGLGLSTVYGIIKQTGGFIFVDSTPGEGSVFRVYLPVFERDAAEEEAAAEERAPRDLTGKETILLVEDEDAVRMFAARALANKGYHVLEAPSGEEALEIVKSHEGAIDLLISDVVMPNMDGPTLVTKARAERPDMRIIFISGYAEDVFRKSLGADNQDCAFLPKPFSLKQLAEQVKESLD